MTLLVFLKAPVPGTVKTRLARSIGRDEAVSVYRDLAAFTRRAVSGLRGARVRWVYRPGPGFPDLAWLSLPRERFWRQSRGGLGTRLRAAFERAFAQSSGPVCAIGVDAASLRPARIRRAFSRLKKADVVLGPAEDGGYWLIGMRRAHCKLFSGIPWSSGRVFVKTLQQAAALGLRCSIVETDYDVDRPADLARWGLRSTKPVRMTRRFA